MESKPGILFICPPDQGDARTFASILAAALPELNIKTSDASLTTLLFETKKYDLVHFFMLGSPKGAPKFGRKGSKTKVVQTFISGSENPEDWKSLVFGDCIVTFSEQDKQSIQKEFQNARVEVIPPCAAQPDPTRLKGPAEIRAKYGVEERMLVVALNDFADHNHFQAFLYTAREYQRKGGFRFLLPRYRQDKESSRWRDSLKTMVEQEKLSLTSFVEPSEDYHSLIDSADFCLYISKARQSAMEFPLNVAEALCAGKPVICYNTAPVHEVVGGFKNEWVARTNEDFSRISFDLLKQSLQLEQTSTELARYARAKLSVSSVSQRYNELYNSLIQV